MIHFLTILLAVLLLSLLLFYEKKENRKRAFLTKTLLSLLFVVAAAMQPHPRPNYSSCLLIGLIFCAVGDVCLALPERFFKGGLAAFLLGHGFYLIGFAALTNWVQWLSPGALLLFMISAFVFLWLRPHAGAMLGPVFIYILVITAMVSAAWAVFRESALPAPGRSLILLGAVSFYVSDLFVARNKFIKTEFLNRLVGLPLYYLGQFLLAFSPGSLG